MIPACSEMKRGRLRILVHSWDISRDLQPLQTFQEHVMSYMHALGREYLLYCLLGSNRKPACPSYKEGGWRV